MAPPASVDEVLDELYRTPPDTFVARRTELAGELTVAGDKAGAKQLKAAKRPTLAAWALNQLRYEAPDLVDDAGEVADLGRRMLTGDAPGDARALSQRRRDVAAARTVEARRVLKSAGEASAAIERQVVETLDAALVSPEVADQLLAGRLLAATTATGFEGLLALPGGGEDAAAGGLVDRTKRRPKKAKDGDGPALRVIDGGRTDDDAAAAELGARRAETAEAASQAEATLERLAAEAQVAAEEHEDGQALLETAEAELRAAQAKALALEHRLEEARAREREAEATHAAAAEAAQAAAHAASDLDDHD